MSLEQTAIRALTIQSRLPIGTSLSFCNVDDSEHMQGPSIKEEIFSSDPFHHQDLDTWGITYHQYNYHCLSINISIMVISKAIKANKLHRWQYAHREHFTESSSRDVIKNSWLIEAGTSHREGKVNILMIMNSHVKYQCKTMEDMNFIKINSGFIQQSHVQSMQPCNSRITSNVWLCIFSQFLGKVREIIFTFIISLAKK